MSHKKFLEFKGRSIYFLSVDGAYWVAIKPICNALGIDYGHQLERVKEDEILSQLYGNHRIVAADDRLREMICLPEKWVYGWLFGIRSESAELKEYKLTCYNLLYDYFHGAITQRIQTLQVRSQADIDIEKWEAELKLTEPYKNLVAAKARKRTTVKTLGKLDTKLEQGQLGVFDDEPLLPKV